jgi:hypothetical protein
LTGGVLGGRQRARSDGVRSGIGLSVVAEEEEQFVLYERSAHAAAKLIEVICALGPAENVVVPAIGVEGFVPIKLERISVKGIRARFGDRVDDAAAGAADFSGVVVGVYLELLHRVFAE